jgi:hypothetical protein
MCVVERWGLTLCLMGGFGRGIRGGCRCRLVCRVGAVVCAVSGCECRLGMREGNVFTPDVWSGSSRGTLLWNSPLPPSGTNGPSGLRFADMMMGSIFGIEWETKRGSFVRGTGELLDLPKQRR